MKRLYARLMLRLIRPALDERAAEERQAMRKRIGVFINNTKAGVPIDWFDARAGLDKQG